VARTGRLSSDQPNLHNIPVRSEMAASSGGLRAAPGCELLVADYNQIELRCIAHLAQDPGLIASFTARPRHPHRDRLADLLRRARAT
jgi:DNA polymerase-1